MVLGSKTRRKISRNITSPDLTILYCNEVSEWDRYLTKQFENYCETPSVVAHEKVEDIVFPLSSTRTQNFSSARVVLIIISPAFLDFLEHNADDSFHIGKLLVPSKTIAMLCGVNSCDITSIHKAAMVSYDDWLHLTARDKDLMMVQNIIETIRERLVRSKECERLQKPKFKIVPRKVCEGNGKVYIILDKPLDYKSKIKVLLEENAVREVPVKQRNPYTLQFAVPDPFMQVMNVINVHVYYGENLLGSSQIKCESKLGQLRNLLLSVNSPYEFLCDTLGVASRYDVDELLVKNFRKNLPNTGFSLLQAEHTSDKVKSEEEFPTLLHFAATYGLHLLTSELLQCPGARIACAIKNVRGLTPLELANESEHVETTKKLGAFQKFNFNYKNGSEREMSSSSVLPLLQDSHLPENVKVPLNEVNYDASSTENPRYSLQPEICISPQENRYLSMNKDNNAVFFPEHQQKLIDILNAFKKGATFIEVEKLQREWKMKYNISDEEGKKALDEMRCEYARVQKNKLNKKQSSSFSELCHFVGSKLRKKENADSKSEKNKKQTDSQEKYLQECNNLRPVSTVSVMSNASGSSNLSSDQISSASVGSDSSNQSDCCEYKRFQANVKNNSYCNITELRKYSLPTSLNKSFIQSPSLEQTFCSQLKFSNETVNRSNSLQLATPQNPCVKILNITGSSLPKSKKNNFPYSRNEVEALNSSDTSNSDNAEHCYYDIPPVPRVYCPGTYETENHHKATKSEKLPNAEYDILPSPVPVCPQRTVSNVRECCDQQTHCLQDYDIPNPVPTVFVQNSDYDLPRTIEKLIAINKNKNDKLLYSNVPPIYSLPSVPDCDSSDKLILENLERNFAQKSPYYNVWAKPLTKEISAVDDDIPDEMAPLPPVSIPSINDEEEEYYKTVGVPIPVENGD